MTFEGNVCKVNVRLASDEDKNWPVSYCRPKGCTRTRKEREEEVQARLNNRIFFQGLTALGYQQPIREAVNPHYRDEPSHSQVSDFQTPSEENKVAYYEKLAEKFRSVDVYGHKFRHTRKEHGPEKRFCVPIVNSFNYGWWTRDLPELNKTKWYAPRRRFPTVRGEVTRFVDDLTLHDPNFIYF